MAENVDPKIRHDLLGTTTGHGDVVLDLQGSRYLHPADRAVVESRPRSSVRAEVAKPVENPEHLPPWWWNPSNPMSAQLPADVPISRYNEIITALRKMDPKIGFTWNPVRRVWQLWYHKPGFTNNAPWTNGWIMVKEFKPFQGTAYILKCVQQMDSVVVGSAKERHAKMIEARKLKKQKGQQLRRERDAFMAGEAYDYMQVKSIGSGDKSARFG